MGWGTRRRGTAFWTLLAFSLLFDLSIIMREGLSDNFFGVHTKTNFTILLNPLAGGMIRVLYNEYVDR